MTNPPPVKLSIVVPAYNEEAAIRGVIENVLAARPEIIAKSRVEEVEIIVVDDGSRDRTAAIAGEFPDVTVVSHPENRGYGAALKTGFARATGDLLGFLDGDGTCDAKDFAELCRRADEADMVLGTRLGRGSRMPGLRRLGNRFFAGLTRLLSGARVTDVATGMRVLWRGALERIPPLPDGLHYTPALSCHALCLSGLRVAEHAISYGARLGKSKLGLVRDGVRFLKIILDTALLYAPLKILGSLGFLCLALGLAYGIGPLLHYLREGSLEEGMIYRLLAIVTFATVGTIFVVLGIAGQKTVRLVRGPQPGEPPLLRAVYGRGFHRCALVLGTVMAWAGVALNVPNLVEYVRYQRISSHWSYVLVGGLLVVIGALFFAVGVLCRMIDLFDDRGR